MSKRPPVFHRSVPLHHQIQRLLRAKIESKEWGAGHKLPTELQLAQHFQVSRTTIRHALQWLERDGLITRHRSRGTFVSAASRPTGHSAKVKSILLGYKAEVRMVNIRRVQAPPRVAEFLHLPKDHPVQQFVRVEYVDGLPWGALFNYMQLELGEKISRDDLMNKSMLECLIDRLEVPFGRVRQSVRACLPDEEVALLLHIDVTEPTLLWQVQMMDEAGKPVQICDMYYRGDRCRYEVDTPYFETEGRAKLGDLDNSFRKKNRRPQTNSGREGQLKP